MGKWETFARLPKDNESCVIHRLPIGRLSSEWYPKFDLIMDRGALSPVRRDSFVVRSNISLENKQKSQGRSAPVSEKELK